MKTIILILLFVTSLYPQNLLLMGDDAGSAYNSNADLYFDSLAVPLTDSIKQFLSETCDCLDDSLNGGARDKTLLQLGFDRIGLFANETQEAARLDLVRLTDITEVSDILWTKLEGYTGDAAADYINTTWNPASGTNNFTLNSGSFGVYFRNSVDNAATQTNGSVDVGGRRLGLRERLDSQINSRFYVNNATVLTLNGNGAGFYSAFRTHADTVRGVRNSTFAAGSQTAVAIPNLVLYLNAVNSGGTAVGFASHQIAYWFIGKGWYGAQITAIKNCFETKWMDKIGKGVIP